MASIFADLLAFFGISSTVPQNLGELLPWLFAVLCALGLFLFVFKMIGTFLNSMNRRW